MSEVKKSLPLYKDVKTLPTNKNHISFSELYCWNECAWRHKLIYVDGFRDGGSEHTLFGGSVHDLLESWLLSKDKDGYDIQEVLQKKQNEVLNLLSEYFQKYGEEEVKTLSDTELKVQVWKTWCNPIAKIVAELPSWMEETFPDWQPVHAELELFEPIETMEGRTFKGFVDCVLKVPTIKQTKEGSKVEWTYWILDWKTTKSGWSPDKKRDKFKRMQLALYKHFVSQKLGIPLSQLQTGFVLLKRTAKKISSFELVPVSCGPKTIGDALGLLNKAIVSIARGFVMKNRNSCNYCQFNGTPHCP